MNDKVNIKAFIESLRIEVQNNPKLSAVYDSCKLALIDLYSPLRVAITGVIKTGKSTLLNALLGKYIVPTAVEVMTYNVNWFHHVKYSDDGKEKIVVQLLDGMKSEYPIEKLSEFVGYSSTHKELLDSVHWVDVYLNHPLLEVFDLIDTPGLDSLMGTDSQHTRDLLTREENRPDAIIYLVYPEFKNKDITAVADFHQSTGLISGMNSIAALTRADMMAQKFEEAEEKIHNNKERYADIRYYFLNIYPIAALPAQASFMLDDNDIELLRELPKIHDIATFTADYNTFVEKFNWQTKGIRSRLCTILSIDGIRLSLEYFEQYPCATAEQYKSYLYDFSRVDLLKSVIVEHFGGRADFHKCNRVLAQMKRACSKTMQQKEIGHDARIALQKIKQQINELDYELHQHYAEYYILNDYYNMEDYFTEDEWEEVKYILGEYGREDFERLRITKNASKTEIQSAYDSINKTWQKRAVKYGFLGNTRANEVSLQIAKIIQSYSKNV